jgi:L-malate glycosyltransferase
MICIIRIAYEFYPLTGGSVTHITELSRNVDKFVDQLIIAPTFGEEEKCKEFDKNETLKIKRIKFKPFKRKFGIPISPINHIIYLSKVINYLRTIKKPDLIHVHYMDAAAALILYGKFSGIPVIAMQHGSDEAYSRASAIKEENLAKIFKPVFGLILDDGSKAPEKFKKLWGDKAIIVHHGIDTDIFCPREKKNINLLKKLNLKDDHFIILSTNSLSRVKSIDLALEAFKVLIENISYKNIYLIIAGDGNQKESLLKLKENLSLGQNVLFIGDVPSIEIPDYISISDIVIGTSLYSNLNRSIQEAMSCGKPVVVFNSGGTYKLIKHMQNGLLVDPGNLHDFSENIKLLYQNDDLRLKLGDNARKTILKERSWTSRIEKELNIYKKVMKKEEL